MRAWIDGMSFTSFSSSWPRAWAVESPITHTVSGAASETARTGGVRTANTGGWVRSLRRG